MDSWKISVVFFLFSLQFSFVKQQESNATIIQSYVDVEGNRIYKYIFGPLIDKEPEVSNPDNENNLETGDQIMSVDQTGNIRTLDTRKFIDQATSRWPHRKIPFVIKEGSTKGFESDGPEVEKILAAMHHWESVTCLEFVPKQELTNTDWKELGHKNFIYFENGMGCYSYVGFKAGKQGQVISLKASSCMKPGTILHEIGHALGFYHEQNRSDRDDHLEVRLENVKEVYRGNFRKFPSQNDVTYDYNSVMHYGRKYFSLNELDTLVTKDQNLGFLLGNEDDLTFYDIKAANLAYDCDSECSETVICENDGFINSSCTCYCPPVVEGDRCENIAADLNKAECGSSITLLSDQDKFVLQSPNYPFSYSNTKCAWLVKSPVGKNITIQLMLRDIPRNSRTHKCYHSLEIRYNLIGQYGPRLCGNTQHPVVLQSTGNAVMIILHAENNDYFGSGFEIEFSTGEHTSVCIPNPCNGAKQVCIDEGMGAYKCLCPAHLQGEDCKIVDYIDCNFDAKMGPEELCLFSQSKNDDMNWGTREGETLSDGTGPSDDYGGSGYYLFIEASAPAKTGYKAILNSAEIVGGIKCFSFFYHMYGSHMGELQVTVHAGGKQMDWIQVGDKGNQWHEADIEIRTSQNFWIELIAVRGSGFRSDAAIDSVRLRHGACVGGLRKVPLVDLSDGVPLCKKHFLGTNCSYVNMVYCDFDDEADHNGWCIFSNDDSNDVDWLRHRGQTDTPYTGPSADLSQDGYYLYVESTAPAKLNDIARMSTPFIEAGQKCVDFFYHVHGDEQQMGTFNVSFIDENDNLQSFITSGDHGNTWHPCHVSVTSQHMFKVVFSYTVGSGFRGDVAIDVFSVSDGLCMAHRHYSVELPGNQDGHSNKQALVSMD